MAKAKARRTVSPRLFDAERRSNRRLRVIITDLSAQVLRHRKELDVQGARVAQLQADVDLLKRSAARHRKR